MAILISRSFFIRLRHLKQRGYCATLAAVFQLFEVVKLRIRQESQIPKSIECCQPTDAEVFR